jgi:hypothetical protein
MIDLHALATKLRTKVSVPTGTPIPMKPSGQKEARETSALRELKAGLLLMMQCATCIKGSQSRAVVDDAVRNIERSLLRGALGEDGGLGDVEVKSSILLEDVHKLSQDL